MNVCRRSSPLKRETRRYDAILSFIETVRIGTANVRDSAGADGPRSLQRRQLLIAGPGVFTTYPLPESGSVEIGRSELAQLRIDDLSASRRHATLHVGQQVLVEDHGAINGTFVRGAAIPAGQPVPVAPGEAIQIGETLLVLQQRPMPLRIVKLWPHVYFEARVEDECQRSRVTGLPCCLMRLAVPEGTVLEQLAQALENVLRWTDALAVYAPGWWELLLSTRQEDELDAVIELVAEALEAAGVSSDPVVARCPDDGRTADALLARVHELVHHEDQGAEASGALIIEPSMKTVFDVARRAAAADISILVLGETGVGKDVLARHVHTCSARASRPYLTLNCAALNETLVESELFGHERGAFTGAVAAKPGLLESAHGGTVFLDEVGELSPTIQAKLLRVLETREITRLGSVQSRKVDVRFVAATNRDLEQEVEQGRFRRDLFFRLAVVALTIVPLRQRRSEIVPMAERFIAAACQRNGRVPVPHLSPDAAELLMGYPWPGNLRELRNMMERALVFCPGVEIQTAHLPTEKLRPEPPPARTADAPMPEAGGSTKDERERILNALQTCAGNQTRAAQLLGMPRRTLLRRLASYGIARPQSPT